MKHSKSFLACGVAIAAAHLVSAQTVFNTLPSRTVGQPSLQQSGTITEVAPNLVEGRELFFPEAVAVDTSVTPAIVYVADTLNNRVLAWKNASAFQTGAYADLVIGQRDFFTTYAKGPGTDLTTGLAAPSGLVVDKSGNLYVADSGNNRIVRYPTPFQQTSQLLSIDMVLGQKDLNSRSANQASAAGASATTLSLANQLVGFAFDSNGNLWVSDGGNNRLLRYPVASLASGQKFDPAADTVLGQPDFVTTSIPSGFNQASLGTLNQPGALAFSPEGQLFVGDNVSRVLVYVPPFSTGEAASRVMGARVGNPPPVSQNTIGAANGIFFANDSPFIIDTSYNRILQYAPYSQWPAATTAVPSPTATKVYGQPDFASSSANAGLPQPTDLSFASPTSGVMLGTDLYISDSGNNRVLDIPQVNGLFLAASRVLGQVDFKYNSLNLIEGKEFDFADSLHQSVGGGIAVDTASSVPHLYVADVFNNRILGFKDARNVQSGQKADLVIGEPDFYTGVPNYPGGTAQSLNASNLSFPEGVAVDGNGDLWVADTGNGRVLRFPQPFAQTAGGMQQANLVIGQTSFGSKITDASSQTMAAPWGIAFTTAGHLAVSDSAQNRVLFFRKPTGGDFTIGQSATTVIGEPDFITVSTNEMHSPRGIATDPSDRLYVADTLNSRVLVYPNVTVVSNDPPASFFLTSAAGSNFTNPIGIAVDKTTAEIWVADTFANPGRVVRFPSFDFLISSPNSNLTFVDSGPVALTLDSFGNPIIAESGANRVAFYYHANGSNGNAANYFARYSPGMLATVKPSANSTFGSATVTNSKIPVPTTLGDVQVVVNGVLSPIIYASPTQINFQIPSTTPASSTPVEIDVIRTSTGQVLSAGEYRIDPYSPGLFTADATGTGALIAQNQDGSLNGTSHPAKAGSVITLYGTGEGVISGAPPDGTPPTGALSTSILPSVVINGGYATVQYSGVAPGFIGLWQINVVVPANVPPGPVAVAVEMDGAISTLDPNNNRIFTTIVTTP